MRLRLLALLLLVLHSASAGYVVRAYQEWKAQPVADRPLFLGSLRQEIHYGLGLRERQRDSLANLSTHRAARERDFYPAREIGRAQVGFHCALTFVLRKPPYGRSEEFHIRARDAFARPLGSGYAYAPRGFKTGDTLTLVVQNVECPRIAGYGMGRGMVPTQEELARLRAPGRTRSGVSHP